MALVDQMLYSTCWWSRCTFSDKLLRCFQSWFKEEKNNADVKQPELITFNQLGVVAKFWRANLQFELQDLKYAQLRRGVVISPKSFIFEIYAPVIYAEQANVIRLTCSSVKHDIKRKLSTIHLLQKLTFGLKLVGILCVPVYGILQFTRAVELPNLKNVILWNSIKRTTVSMFASW